MAILVHFWFQANYYIYNIDRNSVQVTFGKLYKSLRVMRKYVQIIENVSKIWINEKCTFEKYTFSKMLWLGGSLFRSTSEYLKNKRHTISYYDIQFHALVNKRVMMIKKITTTFHHHFCPKCFLYIEYFFTGCPNTEFERLVRVYGPQISLLVTFSILSKNLLWLLGEFLNVVSCGLLPPNGASISSLST